MNNIVYERPREKLWNRGVASLTLPELLQVLLGSGSKGYPVARIARRVAQLIETSSASIDNLMTIDGMGVVKAAQVAVAIELAKRLYVPHEATPPSTYRSWLTEVGHVRKGALIRYCLLDGGGGVIAQYEYKPVQSEHYVYTARRIMRHASTDGVDALSLSLGYSRQSFDLSLYEAGLVRSLCEQADILQVRLRDILIVSGEAVRVVGRRDVV